MKFYRPIQELTGKRLSASTLASFMAAQSVSAPDQIRDGVSMPAQLLRFLLRDRAISYWSSPANRWLRPDPFNQHFALTAEGIKKVRDRLAGRAGAQSVTREAVLDELQIIRGHDRSEPFATFEHALPNEVAPVVDRNWFPDEVPNPDAYVEGATKQVYVTAFERNAGARAECIAHYGLDCCICGFNFERRYGTMGKGFIHVHHLRPLSEIREEYTVNPGEDLRPVCPNCHAMLHAGNETLSIEELRSHLNDN